MAADRAAGQRAFRQFSRVRQRAVSGGQPWAWLMHLLAFVAPLAGSGISLRHALQNLRCPETSLKQPPDYISNPKAQQSALAGRAFRHWLAGWALG